MAAKNAFLAHGPFTLADFGSSIEPAAKFDVSYDPTTAQLKAVVKLSFEFTDAGQQPTKVKGKEVGEQYGKSAWTDEARTRFKEDFRRNVLGVWNSGRPGHPLHQARLGRHRGASPCSTSRKCRRARAHNNIKATKAILEAGANKTVGRRR